MFQAISGTFHGRSTLIGQTLTRIIRSLSRYVGVKIDNVKARFDGRTTKSGEKSRNTTKYSPLMLDQLSAMSLILQMLNGPGTPQRLTILRLAMHHLIYGQIDKQTLSVSSSFILTTFIQKSMC
jgi:hypothetical protein